MFNYCDILHFHLRHLSQTAYYQISLWNHQQCCWFLYVKTCNFGETNPPIPSPRKGAPTETCFDDVGRIVRISGQVSNKSWTTPPWQLDHVKPGVFIKTAHPKMIMIKIMITITIIIVTIIISTTTMALPFNYGYNWRNGCPELNYVDP